MSENLLSKCELMFENNLDEYTVDSFEIIHIVGQGGFGLVYKV